MSESNNIRLKVIADRNSSESSLLESVQQLQTICENRHFWAAIINDEAYGDAHRRIAFVQYFIRHAFQKHLGELELGSLNVSPFKLESHVVGIFAGVMPVKWPLGNAVIIVNCFFGDAGFAAIYLSVFPKAGDSELLDLLMRGGDSSHVVTDVAAGEQLTSGAHIQWRRWQQGQVYECLPN